MKTTLAVLVILTVTTYNGYCKAGGWIWDLMERSSVTYNNQCHQQASYHRQPVYYTQPRTFVYYNDPVYYVPAPSLYQPRRHRPNSNYNGGHCQ